MKKIRKRLVLDAQTVRNLSALEAARVVGGASLNFCPTVPVCPSRMCTIFPSNCPM